MGRLKRGLYERPFGKLPGLGLGLALFMYAAAVMLVVNRLLPAWLPEAAAQRYAQQASLWTAVLFGGGTLCLYGIAAKLSDSYVDTAAYLLGAAASVCRVLAAVLPGLLPTAAVSLLFWMCMTAAFLLLSINRENTQDSRHCAALAVPFLLLSYAGNALTHYAAGLVFQARADLAFRGLRLLAVGGQIAFFAGIIAYVLMATTFLFLRTPTRAILYPKEIED